MVYFGIIDGHLYAVDAQSGQERWEFQADGVILSKPAVSDGVVYVGGGGLDPYLHAVDAQSGQERWRFKAAGRVQVSSPAVSDGVVYFGTPPAISTRSTPRAARRDGGSGRTVDRRSNGDSTKV